MAWLSLNLNKRNLTQSSNFWMDLSQNNHTKQHKAGSHMKESNLSVNKQCSNFLY